MTGSRAHWSRGADEQFATGVVRVTSVKVCKTEQIYRSEGAHSKIYLLKRHQQLLLWLQGLTCPTVLVDITVPGSIQSVSSHVTKTHLYLRQPTRTEQ